MKHIVIAGGGFAGVRLARNLRKQKQVRVTLINNSEDFRYSPALYRAATGFKIGTARIPLEWMLLDAGNTELIIGKVTGVNKDNKSFQLEDGRTIPYDYAVMAVGAVTTYFDIKGLDKHSYGVKSFEEIISLKHHIHDDLVSDTSNEQNFVIVGAGPTGVELAGALGAYLKSITKKHKIKKKQVAIYLVEASPRILPQMTNKASLKAAKRLNKLGVHILTDTKVLSETTRRLKTTTGYIETQNTIWTAGTTNNPIFKLHPDIFKLGDNGKVKVSKHLQSASAIYVCGDNADTEFSGLAQTAIKHADFLARDIAARIEHRPRKKLAENHPVQIVPVGDKWAVFQYRRIVLAGRPISSLRKLADIVGYTEVLGFIKALTIWKEGERTEDSCNTCRIR